MDLNDLEVPETTRTVLETDHAPDEKGLGRGITAPLKMLRENEWPICRLIRTVVHVSNEYRKHDSKRMPGEEAPRHRRGELVKPAHDETFWWLHAAYPPLRLAMRVGWSEGVTDAGKRSFKFMEAICADPIGVPKEFFCDYSVSANDLKQKKDEPEWAHADRSTLIQQEALQRDYNYNDGKSWLDRRPVFTSATDFTIWLKEAIEMPNYRRETA